MSNILSGNLKYLRNRKGWTQANVATKCGISRQNYNNYEQGYISNPQVETLCAFSDCFQIGIDSLVRIKLSLLRIKELEKLITKVDIQASGAYLRILPIVVNAENQDSIECIPIKASAGYLTNFNDPNFFRNLETFNLPFLSKNKKYRAFQLTGDSMLPIPDKSWVICEYIDNWTLIKDGTICVIIAKELGIVFKKVRNEISKQGRLQLISLNKTYNPFFINVNKIKEIWKFQCFISTEVPDAIEKGELKKLIHEFEMGLKKVV